jgi:copper chaperone
MKELSVEIEGMTCNGCVRSVTGALKKIAGLDVKEVGVGKAVCIFDETQSKMAREHVINAVVALGFSIAAINDRTP